MAMGYPRSTSAATNYLGIGKESSKGTGVAPTVFIPYQGSVDLDDGQDGADVREAGTGPYLNRKMKTKHDPNGGFSMAVRPKTFAQLAAWFLGNDASGAAGSLYDHTATPLETNVPLTVEQAAGDADDIIQRFTDCYLKSLVLGCKGNEDLMAKFMWFGLSPAWAALATSQSYESGISGSTPGGPYRGADAAYTVDGSSAANVESWEAGLEWKYDEDLRLSKVTRGDTLKLELTGAIKLKQLIDSATVRNDHRKTVFGSTSGTVAIKDFFAAGAFVVVFDNGLSSTNLRQFTLTVPLITWTKATYTKLNPDGETMYLEKEGQIAKGAGAFVTMVSRTADSAAY